MLNAETYQLHDRLADIQNKEGAELDFKVVTKVFGQNDHLCLGRFVAAIQRLCLHFREILVYSSILGF